MTKSPNLISAFFNLYNIILNGIGMIRQIAHNSLKYLIIPKLSDCRGLPAFGCVAAAKQVERSEIPPCGGR